MRKKNKIVLQDIEASMNPTSVELAQVILARAGLEPRKEGSTEKMHKILIELYERAKTAGRQKQPEAAVMTVEELAIFAGITRQTMYDYLKRWLALNLITKTSYIVNTKVIIGYKLNGATLEAAFDRAHVQVNNIMDLTKKYVTQLQRVIKNEKISASQQK
ncbi:hypothetical protein GOV04_00760 [Candidatus Woesearchaeota archaeon]|nr:hypothetical protein [Candidatus Woesearchaeota archaeon]